ncbi:MAG: SPASM domain-containing protein, partial [Acidobacteriota bacterium]
AHGCVSAGHPGGYMYVDWNGKVSPCAFVPYSPVDIHDAYARGKTLINIWADPFFAKLRRWQSEYSNENEYTKGSRYGNLMMPCPIRDHYDEFFKILQEHRPEPVDENAREAMLDPDYRRGMIDYNRALSDLFEPIWKTKYMKGQD